VKILLVALNARYVHTNLAIRSLGEVLEEQEQDNWKVHLKEFSINEHLENIAAEIYEEKPDIIGFSSYIWNISQMITLVRRLRPVLPKAYMLVGGPEVSFDPEDLLAKVPQLDAAIIGEGENSLPALVRAWTTGELPWEVKGLVWRFQKPIEHRNLASMFPPEFQGKYKDVRTSVIITNEMSLCLPDLNKLPNPYSKEENFRGRLAYVETSRGCPFSCQFCISSTFQGIRYLEPERFRFILRKLFSYGARTIKFVDRTFNARKKHAFQILGVFREEAEKICDEAPRAHCEMAGELLDDEWLEYLKSFPEGMIQLEIGVQSTHQPTLDAVNRTQNFQAWKDKVKFLQHTCNIPVHLDLIAGLPFEGWQEIRSSFNEVFETRPNKLQLGFLKVLKGSGMWEKSTDYGLVYSPDAPYAILRTRELTHEEILALRRIEEILEKYYNAGRFKHSLEYILQAIYNKTFQSPFDFFHSFAEYWQQNGWFRKEWKPKALFENLWEFLCREADLRDIRNGCKEQKDIWREALRFDYYLLERPGIVPSFLQGEDRNSVLESKREEIRNHPSWQKRIPAVRDLDKRQWARATAVEYFAMDIPQEAGKESKSYGAGAWYLFYYGEKDNQAFLF